MRDVEFVVTMKAATTNMAAIGKAEAGLFTRRTASAAPVIANAGLDPFNVSSHRRYIHKLPLETDPPPAGNVRARVRRVLVVEIE